MRIFSRGCLMYSLGVLIAGLVAEVALASESSPTSPKEPLAVLDVMTTGVPADQAQLLTELVASEVQSLGRYTVLTGQDITATLSGGGNNIPIGCTDTQCLVDIGLALGVRHILATHVGHIGTSHVVNIKLIAVKETRTERRLYETLEGGAETLLPSIRRLVRKVFDSESAANAPAPSASVSFQGPSSVEPTRWWVPLSIGAIGGVGAGVGAFYGARALRENNKAKADRHPGRQVELYEANRARRNSNIAYGVSAVALLTAAVSWYVLDVDTPADETRMQVAPLVSGNRTPLGLALQF